MAGPLIRRDGDTWALAWDDVGIGMGLERLAERRDELRAEITVESTVAGRVVGPVLATWLLRFDPSSSVSALSVALAPLITARPALTLPMNPTFATFGWATSAAPVSRPPVTTLNTPGGKTSSTARRFATTRGVSGRQA